MENFTPEEQASSQPEIMISAEEAAQVQASFMR
jgi:hypothetical protein